MTVLWDWNGTIIADVPLTVQMENEVFSDYGVNIMVTEDEYRHKFHFPVRSYYEDFGITGDMFSEVAAEWNRRYFLHLNEIPLAKDAQETLRKFSESGMRQVIISASQQEQLLGQVALYPEIAGYFDEILGIEDVYGESKVHIARKFMERTGISAEDAVFIGDTEHDAEVAREIGCRCILVSQGHQTREVLEKTGAAVAENLKELQHLLGVD